MEKPRILVETSFGPTDIRLGLGFFTDSSLDLEAMPQHHREEGLADRQVVLGSMEIVQHLFACVDQVATQREYIGKQRSPVGHRHGAQDKILAHIGVAVEREAPRFISKEVPVHG